LSYTAAATALLVLLLYLVYLGLAAEAVHAWRVGKRGQRKGSGDVKPGMELEERGVVGEA